ncbi:MAG: glycosyltransferase family 39 protein [Proteobacteria bacterium]|nr:glycosyltransferase family 39 protein [Pseudomonadota bacterium]
MNTDGWDHWARAWRGPALAAALACAAGAPAVFALPPLDRDESRFAQATAQMLETGDFTNINFQQDPRHKKPVGIHWLQAISVSVLSSPEARAIWAYRLPSLLGAMLAAAACAWGARAFWGAGASMAAGAILGVSTLLSVEAGIAKTDAVLCAAVTVAMAALARIYAAARGAEGGASRLAPDSRTVAVFWAAVGASILVKGPVGPMVVGLALLALWAMDRDLGWAKRLQWWWGLVICLFMFGPWAMAITVATDAGFWTEAVGGDLAPKLNSGDEGHKGPPGYHLLLSPLMLFPATLLIPAAVVTAWRRRAEPAVRFALAWSLPTLLVFELLPTKLPHYVLPAYGGLAWLLAAAIEAPKDAWTRWSGAGLSLAAGLAFAALGLTAVSQFGDPGDATWAAAAAGLFAAAGLAGAVALLQRASRTALATTAALAVVAHGVLLAGLAPRLEPLWLSERTSRELWRTGLHPRSGLAPGPVEASGFAEPSLVFALGTGTGLGGVEEAAEAIAEGRTAVVAESDLPAFQAVLGRRDMRARAVARIPGANYSNGDQTVLTIFRPASEDTP